MLGEEHKIPLSLSNQEHIYHLYCILFIFQMLKKSTKAFFLFVETFPPCNLKPFVKSQSRVCGTKSYQVRPNWTRLVKTRVKDLPEESSPEQHFGCYGSGSFPWRCPPADTQSARAGRAPRRRTAGAVR